MEVGQLVPTNPKPSQGLKRTILTSCGFAGNVPTNPKPSQGLKLARERAPQRSTVRSNQPKTLSGIETLACNRDRLRLQIVPTNPKPSQGLKLYRRSERNLPARRVPTNPKPSQGLKPDLPK